MTSDAKHIEIGLTDKADSARSVFRELGRHGIAPGLVLEYRIRRLPAAREAARRLGRAGARFAWESARDGVDVTPPAARLATGELVRIRTGELEEHIVAARTSTASSAPTSTTSPSTTTRSRT